MAEFFSGLFLAAVVAALIPSPSMQPDEWKWAEQVCAANGGVDSARASGRFILLAKAWCKNGAEFVRPTDAAKPEVG